MLLNVFLFRPPRDSAAQIRRRIVPTHGTVTHEHEQRVDFEYPFSEPTTLTSIAFTGSRCVTPIYRSLIWLNSNWAVCRKSGDAVPHTGALLSPVFQRVGGSGVASANTNISADGTSYLLMRYRRTGFISQTGFPSTATVPSERTLPIPQAVVSPAETTTVSLVSPYIASTPQAAVPPTGTSYLFYPPPPPEPEPYTTGQTQ